MVGNPSGHLDGVTLSICLFLELDHHLLPCICKRLAVAIQLIDIVHGLAQVRTGRFHLLAVQFVQTIYGLAHLRNEAEALSVIVPGLEIKSHTVLNIFF
jgi:hypothetical protein